MLGNKAGFQPLSMKVIWWLALQTQCSVPMAAGSAAPDRIVNLHAQLTSE